MDTWLEMTGKLLREQASRAHPDERDLERFLRGETSKAERMRGVRHLLMGCPECVAVTRPIWGLADRPRTNRLDPEDALRG